jgi:hypothetical protein
MSVSDRELIRAALECLPEECRYHGARLDHGGIVSDGACCDTGRPALARRRALEALRRQSGADLEARR